MKKTFVLVALVLAWSVSLTAQDSATTITEELETANNYTVSLPHNTIYAEVGGNGSLYSVNVDQIFLSGKNVKISARVGLGISSSIFQNDIDPIIPIEGNVWFGKGKHHLETGLGVVAAFGFDETLPVTVQVTENGTKVSQFQPAQEYTSLYAFTRLGYRFQNTATGGLFFRAGLTPTISAYTKEGGLNPKVEGSIAIGYTFKTKKQSQIPVINYH